MTHRRHINRILALALVLALVVPAGFTVSTRAEAAATGTVAANQLNMRQGPSTDYDKVTVSGANVVLASGDTVSVLGSVDGWYRIEASFGGSTVTGYVKSGEGASTWLKVSGSVPTESYLKGSVTASTLNVRKGPATTYDKLTHEGATVTLKNSDTVYVLSQTDGWYHIRLSFSGSMLEGYCLGSYIKVSGTIPEVSYDGSAQGTSDATPTPTAEPTATPTPTPSGDSSGSQTVVGDGSFGTVSEIPKGYTTAKKGFLAKFAIPGQISAQSGLRLRKSAKTSAKELAILSYGQQVMVTNAYIKNENGVSTRWYRLVAFVDGEYIEGYSVSDYIELDCSDTFTMKTRFAGQAIYKTAGGKTKVKSDGTAVKIGKGSEVTVISEKTVDGVKYFKLSTKYNKKSVQGWVPAIRLAFVQSCKKYSVTYLTKEQPTATPEPTEAPTAEPTPELQPTPTPGASDLIGANAHIKNAAALSVKPEPDYAVDALRTSGGDPVLLHSGDAVEVISVTKVGAVNWCYVRFNFMGTEYLGYINAIYIDSDTALSLMSDGSEASAVTLTFEEKLAAEGFPESYKEPLRALHEQYPNWEFRAFQTGLDWEDAVAHECEVGVNLLPNSYGVEWKSLAQGAYSWKTDSFVVFDGTYWVTASEQAVRYYLDPRNFLDESAIFMFEVLNYSADLQGIDGVNAILKNSFMREGQTFNYLDEYGNTQTLDYSSAFMMAAEYSGVSPYHLASRAKQEVTIGTTDRSKSVTGTLEGYEGLYNFYNIGANNSSVAGQNIKNGLTFARKGRTASLNIGCLIPWTDPFRAILGGGYFLGATYINVGQNTIYLEKFNVTSRNTYSHQYMGNVEAQYSEGVRTSKAYENPSELTLVFSIPVFLNMPETPEAKPTTMYNPNNWLKKLKLTDASGNALELTPSFSYTADCEYSLVVDSSVGSVLAATTTVSSLAHVISRDTFELVPGANRVSIYVEAQDSTVREYVINIYREETANTDTSEVFN